MLKVFGEGDRVMLDLGGRRRDVLLTPLQAERLADALGEFAAGADVAEPSLVRGEAWGVFVTSFDRKVALRFTPPWGAACERVPLPPKVARLLAEKLRENAQWAGYGLRVEREVADR